MLATCSFLILKRKKIRIFKICFRVSHHCLHISRHDVRLEEDEFPGGHSPTEAQARLTSHRTLIFQKLLLLIICVGIRYDFLMEQGKENHLAAEDAAAEDDWNGDGDGHHYRSMPPVPEVRL